MSTNSSLIKVGGLEVLLLRKDIKNMHLNVLPPNGTVRVSVPKGTHEHTIRSFIATRLPWIKRQQEKFSNQERQSAREYVSGESHYFFGKRYLLQISEKDEKPSVVLKGKSKIILNIRPETKKNKKREIMNAWYRQELDLYLKKIIPKYAKKIGVKVPEWRIQIMKTKWGSCNKQKKHMLFNLQLAEKPKDCIDYVVLHELIHTIERSHNRKFVRLLDTHMPTWREKKEKLNRFVLTEVNE